MKIYEPKEEKAKKSWALKLERGGAAVFLIAVDATTGDKICEIILFASDGTVFRVNSVRQNLQNAGYDYNEHGNTFNPDGQIMFTE
jgi:hypothetical protein